MRHEKWNIKGYDRDKAIKIYKANVNPLVAVLLSSRGITELEDVKTFLDTDNTPFYDPYLMADMDKAVNRIKQAVVKKEKIAIYGDYDVDGMTSTAMLARWLESKSALYEIYIPGRFSEGYGLNTSALDTLKERGVKLVITVDCGITATDEARYAKNIGLDLVITDHHECKDTLPIVDAVIDPKRHDCKYPFKELAGVGVVFKLICALESVNRIGQVFDRSGDSSTHTCNVDELFQNYGDLLALGTVADVMSVTHENRHLIQRGIGVLNQNPCMGIRQLLVDAGVDKARVTVTTIAYTLAPKLNAAGRMGDPLLSVRLLLSQDALEAEELAVELDRLNSERRSLEQEIFEKAITEISEDEQTQPIILAGKGWHQGVTGIVASRISERFKLPAVIISIDENGIGCGSCRSYGAFSIYDAICTCDDILKTFGGHEMAAGITVAEENIDELRRRVIKFYNANLSALPETGLSVDFEVEKPELLTVQNIKALELMEPFGRDNPIPRLCILGATLTSIQSIGVGKHTKMRIEKSGQYFDCVFFSTPIEDLEINAGDTVDVAFEPQINEYRGYCNVQLHVADVKLRFRG